MAPNDSQNAWSDYQQRKNAQRIAEAHELWKQMQLTGVGNDTVLVLDFVHFGSTKEDVEALASQLSENYNMQVIEGNEPGVWYAKGTTRPQGISLGQEQHLGWVEFMSDVVQSYACVFSTWALEAPSLNARFLSEDIEVEG